MDVEIANGDLLDQTVEEENFSDRNLPVAAKLRAVAEKLKFENNLFTPVNKLQDVLKQVYRVRHKTDKWQQNVRRFETVINREQ